jgi:hypothetical protein
MKFMPSRLWLAVALLAVATPEFAAAVVPISINHERDELRELQRRVDKVVGAGRVSVRADYVGARPGDPDPWFWVNPGHAMEVTLVDRKSPHFVVGWYAERGALPVLDGVEDAMVLDQARTRGACVAFQLPGSVSQFGFYVAPARSPGRTGAHTRWSNRHFNQSNRGHGGPKSAPIEGDVHMLVYDISKWAGQPSWLVACEMSDAGKRGERDLGGPEGDRGERDEDDDDHDGRDYSDVLFIVSGGSVTPALKTTFAGLKRLYR